MEITITSGRAGDIPHITGIVGFEATLEQDLEQLRKLGYQAAVASQDLGWAVTIWINGIVTGRAHRSEAHVALKAICDAINKERDPEALFREVGQMSFESAARAIPELLYGNPEGWRIVRVSDEVDFNLDTRYNPPVRLKPESRTLRIELERR